MIAYLVVRNFGVRIYSSVHGLLAATVAIAAVLGSVLLSGMLKIYVIFAPFLALTGVLALIGSAFFLLLPRNPIVDDSFAEKEAAPDETGKAKPVAMTAAA